MKIKVGQLRQIIREVAEEAANDAVAAIVEPVAKKVVASKGSALDAAFAKATPEEIEDLRALAAGDVPAPMGEADDPVKMPEDVKEVIKDVNDALVAGMTSGALLGLMKACADEAMTKSYPHFVGGGAAQNIVAGAAVVGTVALTAQALLSAYDMWKKKNAGSANESVHITPDLLRRIIKEEIEAAAGAGSLGGLTAAIDDLAATWKEWSATVTDSTGFTKYGPAASNITAVRVLRKDQGTDKWDAATRAAATKNPEAAAWIAAADALPWPSDDVALKVAIMRRWVHNYKGQSLRWTSDDAYITAAGFEPPEPSVLLKPAMSDIQLEGNEWMRLMLGVPGGAIAAATEKIRKTAEDAAKATRRPRRR